MLALGALDEHSFHAGVSDRLDQPFPVRRIVHQLHLTVFGYDDLGRDKLDEIYADLFGAEDALVRLQFVNGTHAITCALFGALKAGDVLGLDQPFPVRRIVHQLHLTVFHPVVFQGTMALIHRSHYPQQGVIGCAHGGDQHISGLQRPK